MELLEHYPTHLQKINTKLDLIPYEEKTNSVSMDLTGIELSSQGEVLCGIQEMETEKPAEDTDDIPGICLEFSTPVQVQNSLENTGVSLDFSGFDEYEDKDNIQISSLIIDDLPEEEEEIEISAKKSSEEKKVKKKIKKKISAEKSSGEKKKKIKEDRNDPEEKECEKSHGEQKVIKKKKKKDESN